MIVYRAGTNSWDGIEAMLNPAVQRSRGNWRLSDLYALIATGQHQLWLAEADGVIVGCCTTQIIAYPNAKKLFIQFLGGTDFSNWMEPGIEVLEKFGREHSCTGIETWGRKGFGKVIDSVGFEPTYTVYEKSI